MNQEVNVKLNSDGKEIHTPSEIATDPAYAGFWVRFVAVLIDGIALQAVIWIIRLITDTSLLHPPVWLTIVQYLLYWTYATVLTVIFGQTLGKMIFGIRVVRQNGKANSWGPILLRETVGKLVSGILLLIGYIIAAFDPNKRALHDHLAKTYVVKKK
jgi:uncharacterized RDD family membrane protein YckC